MMKRIITLISIVVVLCGSIVFSADEFSWQKAKRIDDTLRYIAKNKKPRVFLKKITFNQDDLNSYLNLVYRRKYTPEVKYIKLKLYKENYISGTMKIKLKGEKYKNVPTFLKDIDVEVSGTVKCQNYRMRFNFEKLIINGASFSPEVLDEAFGAAQVNNQIKKSMYDWFDLMPGIKNIIVDEKKITLYY